MKQTPRRFLQKFSAAFYRGSPPLLETLETDAPSKKRALEWARSVAQERGWRFIEVLPICPKPSVACLYRTHTDNLCERNPRQCPLIKKAQAEATHG